MKTRNLLLALGCAAMLTACNNNDEPVVTPAPAMREVTISVDVAEPANTRVAYTEDGTTYKFAWTDTDKLRVFYKDGEEKYADFTIDASTINGKKADFTGTLPDGFTGTVTIGYAETYTGSDDNQVSASNLDDEGISYLADHTILYAENVKVTDGTLPNVKLQHAVAYLLLKSGLKVFDAPGADYQFAIPLYDDNYKYLSFSSEGITEVDKEYVSTITCFDEDGKLTQDVLVYFYVGAGGKTLSLPFWLLDSTGNKVVGEPVTQPAQEYKPGVIYEVKATNTKWLPVTVPQTIDLSANESANCYLVPKAGTYKFKATVKGNGSADLAGISKDTDPETIDKAELIWATFNTATAPEADELLKDIKYEDGYVYFSTGSTYKEGNALVAIKDASDNILWSWHLWFESDDLSAMAQTYPNLDYKMMDRNLGALANCYAADNALDFGFAYQNGRKDPFMMSASRTTYVKVGVLGTYTSFSYGDLAASIKNPTVVFGTDSWGGLPEYWGSNTEKTIFDPCPPGWRVAPSGVWAAAGFSTETFVPKDNDFNTYHGWVFNNVAWFPATGDRWGDNHNNTGNFIRVWAKTHGSDLACDGTKLYDVTGAGSNPGHGYSVRPMKESK